MYVCMYKGQSRVEKIPTKKRTIFSRTSHTMSYGPHICDLHPRIYDLLHGLGQTHVLYMTKMTKMFPPNVYMDMSVFTYTSKYAYISTWFGQCWCMCIHVCTYWHSHLYAMKSMSLSKHPTTLYNNEQDMQQFKEHWKPNFPRAFPTCCDIWLFDIESTKTTSMEDVSTGILEKIKNI